MWTRTQVLRLVSLLVSSLLLSPTRGVASAQTTPGDTSRLRILFVGNSYTYFNDLPRLLQLLAVEARHRRLPEVQAITPGGQTLAGHWRGGKAAEAIRKGGWDYVVLQEQSTRPITDPDSMLTYGRLFVDEIRRAGARPLLFVTWARESQPETQAALTETYRRLAQETGADVVPVGAAWQRVRADRPGIRLYREDGSHPSPHGSYLAAAVFYGVLYGKPLVHPSPYSFSTTHGPPTFETERVATVRLSDGDVSALWTAAMQTVGERRASAVPPHR